MATVVNVFREESSCLMPTGAGARPLVWTPGKSASDLSRKYKILDHGKIAGRPGLISVLGGKLTSPVIAEGKVFVAAVESHTVYALDAQTGARQWQFTGGGRVDSPGLPAR